MAEKVHRCVQCSAIVVKMAHPWIAFLHARALAIEHYHQLAKTDDEIAALLSCDPEQVTMIRHRGERGKDY